MAVKQQRRAYVEVFIYMDKQGDRKCDVLYACGYESETGKFGEIQGWEGLALDDKCQPLQNFTIEVTEPFLLELLALAHVHSGSDSMTPFGDDPFERLLSALVLKAVESRTRVPASA